MSQRIKRKIKHLCQSLLYMTAVRLCPAVRKRVKVEGAGAQGLALQVRSGIESVPGEKKVVTAFSAFGKVLCSLSFVSNSVHCSDSGATVVFKFREQVIEFGTKTADGAPSVKRPGRKAERSQRTGFDLLRFTQILARGDLEEQRYAYNTSAAR